MQFTRILHNLTKVSHYSLAIDYKKRRNVKRAMQFQSNCIALKGEKKINDFTVYACTTEVPEMLSFFCQRAKAILVEWSAMRSRLVIRSL